MISRINLILKTKNLTPAQLAEQIGVQRSNISHLLSGRNNPSLDFVQKILLRFPDINSDWLLFGKGAMYKDSSLPPHPDPTPSQQNMLSFFDQLEENTEEEYMEEKTPVSSYKPTENVAPPVKNFLEQTAPSNTQNSDIERIIIIFKNDTCKIYNI